MMYMMISLIPHRLYSLLVVIYWRMRRERLIRPMCNPVGQIRRGKRRIRQLHRATGGCGVNALSALHVLSRRPDKTRQASHPAFIAPLRTGRQSAPGWRYAGYCADNIFQRGLRPCAVMRRCRTNIAQSFTNPNFSNQLTYRVNSASRSSDF